MFFEHFAECAVFDVEGLTDVSEVFRDDAVGGDKEEVDVVIVIPTDVRGVIGCREGV